MKIKQIQKRKKVFAVVVRYVHLEEEKLYNQENKVNI